VCKAQKWMICLQQSSLLASDGFGSKIFDPGWVSHLWFGLEFGKLPLKTSNFSIFFPSGQKKLLRVGLESTRVRAGSASYLLRVKSKLGSGLLASKSLVVSLKTICLIIFKIVGCYEDLLNHDLSN